MRSSCLRYGQKITQLSSGSSVRSMEKASSLALLRPHISQNFVSSLSKSQVRKFSSNYSSRASNVDPVTTIIGINVAVFLFVSFPYLFLI